MTLVTLFYSAVVGLVIGLVWAFAIQFKLKNGLLYGSMGGIIIGLFLSLIQKASTSGGRIQKGEAMAVSGSLLGLILLGGVSTGIIAWIIRAIFF